LDTVGGIVAGLRDSRLSRFLITDELRTLGGRAGAQFGAQSGAPFGQVGAKLAHRSGAFVPEPEYPPNATTKRMHAAHAPPPFSYTQPAVIGRGGQPYYDVAPADPLPRGLPRDYRDQLAESRMSYGYGSRSSVPYATGSGAEYMAQQGWDRGADERSAGGSVGKISFYGKSNNKRLLFAAFCLLALLLIAAIVVIILFVCGVFRPALPAMPGGGGDLVRNGGPLIPPLGARMSPGSGANLATTAAATFAPEPPDTTTLPRPPPPPPPPPPSTATSTSTTTTTTTTTSPFPIVDRNESRVFQVVLFVVQQANTAYNTRTSFAYMEAFRMINDAVINLVTTSTLQQYTPMTTLEDLRNSGDDLEVRFSIQLTAPSRSAIDAPIVRNVLVADMFKLEARLNQVVIDRNRLTVTR
ncbi:hypothetical protein PENTCL1PPCAC_25461, partial [Pristionchus entomophagus]